ncbi:type II toxin-antitoxin system RelE/ParE family toxin [Scytonema sp. NUACC26]|uniref:type II toxin-antitoxin system RelE/ParE family toxin n=1 Tax=Scytonema sp. NUACC26 TaxID=3140176 RepID=UPI0034DC047B
MILDFRFWIGSSKIDISNFSEEARCKAGFQLRAVQQGQTPTDFKPMPIVGKGVEEIRIRTDEAYRVFYVTFLVKRYFSLHRLVFSRQLTYAAIERLCGRH